MDRITREEIAQRLITLSPADETEVVVLSQAQALTRFTHENIHQNLRSDSTTVRVRVISERRCGVATTTVTDDAGLQLVLARALELAHLAPADPQWPGLPKPAPLEAAAENSFFASTAKATAERRADHVEDIFGVSEQHQLWGAGFVSTTASEVTVANSHGVLCSYEGSEALATVKQSGADATGYGECTSPNINAISGKNTASIAAAKASATAHPRAVEPGNWTVILEPVPFAELLSYLVGHFSAQAIDEGASFLTWDNLNKAHVDPNITLHDDWTHPLAPGMPFDFEGAPRQKLTLFRQGTAHDIVTDSRWAARLKRPNTGHALPAPNCYGPQPLSITIDPGTASLEELIASTERGLLISRFWYIRPVDERQTIVTGMTRDGTFLIENGQIKGGVHNLRFNQSIIGALKKATLGNTPTRTTGLDYTMVVPAVKLADFNFTSSTSF